jgi:soluble P-type ATPase
MWKRKDGLGDERMKHWCVSNHNRRKENEIMKPTESYGTIAIDVDGTLLEYDGWKGLGKFGKPLKGAKAAIQELKSLGYEIVIFTTRGDDIGELEKHLRFWNIPFDRINCNNPEMPANLSHQKIMADVYIDDRAIAFGGNWNGIVDKVKMF